MSTSTARRESLRGAGPCPRGVGSLSPREREILELLARGLMYKEIAESLSIRVVTVNTHVRRIYGKLHVRSRAQAVARYVLKPLRAEGAQHAEGADGNPWEAGESGTDAFSADEFGADELRAG